MRHPTRASLPAPIAMFRVAHVWCFVAALLAGAFGCRSEDEIRTYAVPKAAARKVIAKPQAAEGVATDRMLVAVAPHGGQATFFKLVGPIAQVESVAGDVKRFVESLKVTGDEPPTWKLPEGWREGAGNEFRRATLMVPAGDTTLELAISELPWQTGDAYLLENVNRWRGQLKLPPVGPEQLTETYENLAVGDTNVILVDLAGQSSGNSMAPFAADPTAAPPTQNPAEAAAFDQKTPDGWQSKPVSGMRRAEYQVGDGADAAEVTVFDFSTEKPQMASPLANVDLWRGEIGLPPTDESELAKSAEKVTIGGKEGIFVELVSPEKHEPPEATLAAMSERKGQVWFFKLKGPRDTVLAERERFRTWLDSIQFRSPAKEN